LADPCLAARAGFLADRHKNRRAVKKALARLGRPAYIPLPRRGAADEAVTSQGKRKTR